jgi:hypothetical protein
MSLSSFSLATSSLRAILSVGLVSAAVAAMAGCPGDPSVDDYYSYCDKDGACYRCDAYGCKGTSSSASSSSGQSSSSGGASSSSGGMGSSGMGSSGNVGPKACQVDANCPSGQVCQSSICVAASSACNFNSECKANEVCSNRRCLASCEVEPCAVGFTCDKGACVPTQGPGSCNTSGDCAGETPFCVNKTCAAKCTADAQCKTGEYCDSGACVPDTRPKPNCESDAQCTRRGQTCKAGYCKFTCSSDSQCRAIDARIGYCGSDGVCRTESEARPQCIQKADCQPNQDCIGNQCR